MARKRIRLLATSKNGCFTCKLRRIKCDEGKPTCLRCSRSGKACDGYPGRESPDSFTSEATVPDFEYKAVPARALTTICIKNEHHGRWVDIGLRIILADQFHTFGVCRSVFKSLIPQLCFSVLPVGAAVAAIGSAWALEASSAVDFEVNKANALAWYGFSLQIIRKDLQQVPDGPDPLVLSGLMLSIVEILLRKEASALFHLSGACRMLLSNRSPSEVPPLFALNGSIFVEGNLAAVFRTVDFQTSSFALSKPLELEPIPAPAVLPSIVDVNTAHTVLMQLLHNCYYFVHASYAHKYQAQSAERSRLYEQQSRLVAHLWTWMDHVRIYTPPQSNISSDEAAVKVHLLMLRMNAMSALIHVSCALSPYETDYDALAGQFEQIIYDGETVLQCRAAESNDLPRSIKEHWFAIGPGIIEPLFTTAYKYRNPLSRRRAIRLLSVAGREGPWFGPREACITERLMQLEEGYAGCVVDTDDDVLKLNADYLRDNSTPLPGFRPGKEGGVNDSLSLRQPEVQPSMHKTSQVGHDHDWTVTIHEATRINELGLNWAEGYEKGTRNAIIRFARCNIIEENLRLQSGAERIAENNKAALRPNWTRWVEEVVV